MKGATIEVKSQQKLKTEKSIGFTQIALDKAELALESAQSQQRVAERKLEIAEQELAVLEAQLRLYTLTAPINGRLGRIQVVRGSTLSVGTLVTDTLYWLTDKMLWADMSDWLLTLGVIFSVFTVVTGLIDFFGDRRIRELPGAWTHSIGNATALALAFINALVHTRDAYTSVVPAGLILSTLVVLILLVTGWTGSSLVYRHGLGVQKEPS